MVVSCMRNVSRHNYKNSSVIVDLAMGQIPRSTGCISSSSSSSSSKRFIAVLYDESFMAASDVPDM